MVLPGGLGLVLPSCFFTGPQRGSYNVDPQGRSRRARYNRISDCAADDRMLTSSIAYRSGASTELVYLRRRRW